MQKIKLFIESDRGKDIMVVLIVILVGSGSFLLGRLSKEDVSSGLQVEYGAGDGTSVTDSTAASSNVIFASSPKNLTETPSNNSTPTDSSKNYFASSRGSKYYTLGCSAGKTIKQENRVYFSTAEEAEQAGYTLSSSCQ